MARKQLLFSADQTKTKEDRLDRKSAVSDVLFMSIGEGAIVIDERGNIARVNKIALDILGYNPKDLIGKWYPDTVRAEYEDGSEIPNIERPVIEVFLSGKPVFKRIYYRRKDGSRVQVALTVSPVMLNERPMGAIEIFRDITEEMKLEHAKDEFISIASHQLRTPATVVKQYLGMIIDGYIGDITEEQAEMLKLAYEHNNNQLDIINDLLKIALADADKVKAVRKETDMVQLLNKIVTSQKPDYKKNNMTLLFISKEKKVVCSIDPLQMQMVFENLINNAMKYSSPNSTVSVILKTEPDRVIVQVKDEGIGIDPKDISRLFIKFTRIENVNSTTSGTGLGLYWAKKLVELHQGDISVSSELGKGTTFSVILPIEVHT
ncbi:PAS domain S-box protein [Candidatus Saccharibacteria bacterium]|nr:PAS domain S-box protein [Candidatus Saccharibacteria bacterium]